MTEGARPWASNLSVAEFAALQSVGLDPVGQVLGSAVWLFAWSGRRACGSPGYASTGYGGSRRRLGPPRIVRGLVDTMYAARRAALQRMQDDAAALDADGVVAARLAVRPFPAAGQHGLHGLGLLAPGSTRRALEFSVVGTAVRARSVSRPARPFVCDLSGQDTATVLSAGWVPTGMVMGVGAVVAHDGFAVARMTRRWGATREVPRYSQLAELSRAQARTQLEQDVRRHAGQTAVVASIRVDVHEQQCSNAGGAGRDHLVETVIVGSSLAPFRRSDGHRGPTAVLPVLRLRPPAATGQQPEALLADPLLTTPTGEPSR